MHSSVCRFHTENIKYKIFNLPDSPLPTSPLTGYNLKSADSKEKGRKTRLGGA